MFMSKRRVGCSDLLLATGALECFLWFSTHQQHPMNFRRWAPRNIVMIEGDHNSQRSAAPVIGKDRKSQQASVISKEDVGFLEVFLERQLVIHYQL